MIDHDRLFKELISTFFVEFLDLFLPEVVRQIERDSIQFLPQEVFNDVTSGEKKEIDLLAKVRYQQQETYFLIYVENQSYSQNLLSGCLNILPACMKNMIYQFIRWSYSLLMNQNAQNHKILGLVFRILMY
jgi:hypothetical protein